MTGEARDPGLQPERTLLAWRRTALGLMANAALLVASGLHSSTVRLGLGIVVTVLALGFWAAVGAAYRGSTAPQRLGSEQVVRLVAGIILVVGVFDLYAVLTH